MGKTKLEKLADQFRIDNTKANTYLPGSGKQYDQGHPNALADGDDKGRGINGNPTYPGTGRNQLIARNESKYGSQYGPNGYGPSKPYYPNYIYNNVNLDNVNI
jgi:hypothetical protein